MKAFEYAAPQTEAEVLSLLSDQAGKTELLAGGTDLVGLMKKMVITPDRVVNIDQIESMQSVERDPTTGELIIGAVVHLDDLLESPYLPEYPAIEQAIRGINSAQLQAQGTVGGEICRRPNCWYFRDGHGLLAGGGQMATDGDSRYHAIFGNSGPAKFVSASRIAPALIALGAGLRILGPSPDEQQIIAADDFFRTPEGDSERETILGSRQLMTHIIIPPADGRTSGTYEVRTSEGPDMPLATASACLAISGGVVQEAKIVLGQVAPEPWISDAAARAIVGRLVTEQTAAAAGLAAVADASPLADNQYKVRLAQVAVRRAILSAAGLETGGF